MSEYSTAFICTVIHGILARIYHEIPARIITGSNLPKIAADHQQTTDKNCQSCHADNFLDTDAEKMLLRSWTHLIFIG